LKKIFRLSLAMLGVFVRLTLGLVVVLALVALGALAALQTAPGQAGAARLINTLASGPDISLKISGLEIGWGLDARIARIEVGDAQGLYLTLSGLALDWSPSALFSRTIAIERARIEQVYLARLPVPGAPSEDSGGGGLPFLPPLTLDQAEIPEIVLGEAVAGEAMRLSAHADARIQAEPQLLEANLDISRLDEAASEIGAHVRFAPAADTLMIDIAATEPRGGLAARLLEIEGLPALDLTIKGDGPLNDWAADLRLALDGQTEISGSARMAETGDGRRLDATLGGDLTALAPPVAHAFLMGRTAVETTVSFSRDFAPRTAKAEVRTDTLHVTGNAELGDETLTAKARVDLSAGNGALIALELPDRRVTIGDSSLEANVSGPRDSLDWSLALTSGSTETTEVRLADLDMLASGSGLDLATVGKARLPVRLKLAARRITPLIEGAQMFDGPLSLTADARLDPAAAKARIESLAISLAPLTATLSGEVGADALDTRIGVEIADLSAFDPRVTGGLKIDATASGAPASPAIQASVTAERLEMAGKPVTDVALDIDATTTPGDLSADLELSASVDGNPLAGTATLAPDGPGLAGRTLRISVGDNRISGDLGIADLARAAETLSADLTISAPDLSQLSALALTELAGSLNGKATIRPAPDGLTADATLSGENIAAAGARIARLSADARAERLLSAPAINANATLENLTVGGQDIARLVANARTNGDDTDITADARLAKGERADGIALAARVSQMPDGVTVKLTQADGRYQGLTTSLAGPATIASAGGTTRIEGLALKLGDGRLEISGSAGESLDISARATSIPLSLANAFAPGFGIAGRAGGTATVSGQSSAPRASWSFQLTDVSAGPLAQNGISALAIDTRGDFSGQRITQTTRISGGEGLALTASGPVSLEGGGRLDINLDGNVPLAAARQKLILSGFSGNGALAVSGRVGGSFAAPTYAVTLRPQGMSLTQLSSGLTLQDFAGAIQVRTDGVALDGIRARVAAGGTVTVGGRVGLGAGMPADISVALDQVRYSDGRIVQATVSANLALNGPLSDAARGARMSGTVNIARAEITIPSSLPAAIDPVSVVHVNAPEAVRKQDQALQLESGSGSGGGGSSPIALDIQVNAPGQIFVRGRGLDAEMGGSLRIAGTTASPQAIGGFSMRRGLFNVLSRRVIFNKGEVSFSGSLDPRLNFLASTQASAATINISITGPAQKPDIAFTSSPELPQDEVLAQFLFDRSMSELSPTQIAQLGASVLTLTGGSGGGPLGALRSSLGLDAIDIDTSGKGDPSLSVGKYINDRIYLGVNQGTSGDSSRVTVDIDVTKSLKLRGEVGADGESKAGIFFEREFGK